MGQNLKAEVLQDDEQIRVRKWAAPQSHGDVVLCELKTWEHDLPRMDKGAPITAIEEAWTFFQSHPKKVVTRRPDRKMKGNQQ